MSFSNGEFCSICRRSRSCLNLCGRKSMHLTALCKRRNVEVRTRFWNFLSNILGAPNKNFLVLSSSKANLDSFNFCWIFEDDNHLENVFREWISAKKSSVEDTTKMGEKSSDYDMLHFLHVLNRRCEEHANACQFHRLVFKHGNVQSAGGGTKDLVSRSIFCFQKSHTKLFFLTDTTD